MVIIAQIIKKSLIALVGICGYKNPMKIATWNINSVRLRQGLVLDFLKKHQPDILALQETKVIDELFPLKPFVEAGYTHTVHSGEKSYNGVAIISRLPLKNITIEQFVNGDRRHISATLPSGIEFHNFYVPAGGDEPDTKINPKFAHKLDFVDAMIGYFVGRGARNVERNKEKELNMSHVPRSTHHAPPIIIAGDFNIAPYEHDVWSHKQLLKVVSHTPIEVEKLTRLRESLDWVDVMRHFIPEPEKLYSWWSYRNRDWKKSNRGRRLDHIWVTPALKPALKSGSILREARDFTQPSDHVPVIIELDI